MPPSISSNQLISHNNPDNDCSYGPDIAKIGGRMVDAPWPLVRVETLQC